MNTEKFKNSCEALGLIFRENEDMKRHTSFSAGGNADLFSECGNTEHIPEIIKAAKENGVPLTFIGRGTNILVSDRGIEGAVVTVTADKTEINGETVFAEAGVPLTRLCTDVQRASLTGMEFAFGIPGTLGGAVFMNAGAYGGEMADIVISVTSVDRSGNIKTRGADELKFGYRTSVFKENGEVILSAKLRLRSGNAEEIKSAMNDFAERRKAKQPLEYPSAGSAFKRPEGHFAGALIEQCGLKGASVGGAAVSEKHAGFVINKGGASADDILALVSKIQDTVKEKTGVELEPEIIYIGRK